MDAGATPACCLYRPPSEEWAPHQACERLSWANAMFSEKHLSFTSFLCFLLPPLHLPVRKPQGSVWTVTFKVL